MEQRIRQQNSALQAIEEEKLNLGNQIAHLEQRARIKSIEVQELRVSLEKLKNGHIQLWQTLGKKTSTSQGGMQVSRPETSLHKAASRLKEHESKILEECLEDQENELRDLMHEKSKLSEQVDVLDEQAMMKSLQLEKLKTTVSELKVEQQHLGKEYSLPQRPVTSPERLMRDGSERVFAQCSGSQNRSNRPQAAENFPCSPCNIVTSSYPEPFTRHMQELTGPVSRSSAPNYVRAGQMPQQSQFSPRNRYMSTPSSFKVAIASLRNRAQTKDQIITSLADELRTRAQKNEWQELINRLEQGCPQQCVPDYDRMHLCEYLEKPKPVSDSTMTCIPARPPIPSTYPKVSYPPSPMRLQILRQVDATSILLGWDLPSKIGVTGYEIYVNGILHHRIRSGSRCQALIQNLDLSKETVLTMYSLNQDVRSLQPAQVVYPAPRKSDLETSDIPLFSEATAERLQQRTFSLPSSTTRSPHEFTAPLYGPRYMSLDSISHPSTNVTTIRTNVKQRRENEERGKDIKGLTGSPIITDQFAVSEFRSDILQGASAEEGRENMSTKEPGVETEVMSSQYPGQDETRIDIGEISHPDIKKQFYVPQKHSVLEEEQKERGPAEEVGPEMKPQGEIRISHSESENGVESEYSLVCFCPQDKYSSEKLNPNIGQQRRCKTESASSKTEQRNGSVAKTQSAKAKQLPETGNVDVYKERESQSEGSLPSVCPPEDDKKKGFPGERDDISASKLEQETPEMKQQKQAFTQERSSHIEMQGDIKTAQQESRRESTTDKRFKNSYREEQDVIEEPKGILEGTAIDSPEADTETSSDTEYFSEEQQKQETDDERIKREEVSTEKPKSAYEHQLKESTVDYKPPEREEAIRIVTDFKDRSLTEAPDLERTSHRDTIDENSEQEGNIYHIAPLDTNKDEVHINKYNCSTQTDVITEITQVCCCQCKYNPPDSTTPTHKAEKSKPGECFETMNSTVRNAQGNKPVVSIENSEELTKSEDTITNQIKIEESLSIAEDVLTEAIVCAGNKYGGGIVVTSLNERSCTKLVEYIITDTLHELNLGPREIEELLQLEHNDMPHNFERYGPQETDGTPISPNLDYASASKIRLLEEALALLKERADKKSVDVMEIRDTLDEMKIDHKNFEQLLTNKETGTKLPDKVGSIEVEKVMTDNQLFQEEERAEEVNNSSVKESEVILSQGQSAETAEPEQIVVEALAEPPSVEPQKAAQEEKLVDKSSVVLESSSDFLSEEVRAPLENLKERAARKSLELKELKHDAKTMLSEHKIMEQLLKPKETVTMEITKETNENIPLNEAPQEEEKYVGMEECQETIISFASVSSVDSDIELDADINQDILEITESPTSQTQGLSEQNTLEVPDTAFDEEGVEKFEQETALAQEENETESTGHVPLAESQTLSSSETRDERELSKDVPIEPKDMPPSDGSKEPQREVLCNGNLNSSKSEISSGTKEEQQIPGDKSAEPHESTTSEESKTVNKIYSSLKEENIEPVAKNISPSRKEGNGLYKVAEGKTTPEESTSRSPPKSSAPVALAASSSDAPSTAELQAETIAFTASQLQERVRGLQRRARVKSIEMNELRSSMAQLEEMSIILCNKIETKPSPSAPPQSTCSGPQPDTTPHQFQEYSANTSQQSDGPAYVSPTYFYPMPPPNSLCPGVPTPSPDSLLSSFPVCPGTLPPPAPVCPGPPPQYCPSFIPRMFPQQIWQQPGLLCPPCVLEIPTGSEALQSRNPAEYPTPLHFSGMTQIQTPPFAIPLLVPVVPHNNLSLSRNAPIGNMPSAEDVAQLASTLKELQLRCQDKDQMIAALANELRLYAQSHIWENMLTRVAADELHLSQPSPDFDANVLSAYLERPVPYEQVPLRQLPEEVTRLPPPSGLSVQSQTGPNSLMITWNPPDCPNVCGYEIHVNDVLQHRVRSPSRNSEHLEGLQLPTPIKITMYSINSEGVTSDPVTIHYPT